MKTLPNQLTAFFPRESRLFEHLETEEVHAPERIDWSSLDHELFIAFKVHGDLKGFIMLHCQDDQALIYERLNYVVEVSTLLVKQFLNNLSNQLDLNVIIEEPFICPAAKNFSSDSVGNGIKILDFQQKRKLLQNFSVFKDLSTQQSFQFERAFRFKLRDFELKMYLCVIFSPISERSN